MFEARTGTETGRNPRKREIKTLEKITDKQSTIILSLIFGVYFCQFDKIKLLKKRVLCCSVRFNEISINNIKLKLSCIHIKILCTLFLI